MIDFGKVPGYKSGPPMSPGSYTQGASQNWGQKNPSLNKLNPTVGQTGAAGPQAGTPSYGQPQAQPQAAAQPAGQQNIGAPAPQAQNTPQQVSAQPAGGPGYNMGFNVPQQLGQAGQVYGQLAQGQFTIPQQIQQASGYANQMAQNGNPTSTADYARSAMPVIQKQMEDIRKQAMAGANVSGMGNSSVLGQQIGQQQGDLMNQFNMNLANQQMGLDESSKQRMLSGMGMLGQLGGQELQADQFGQGMALQGAQGLQGLGQQYWNMPFQLSSGMSGLGGQYNQAMTTPLDSQYLQAMQLGTAGGGQNQYTQSFGGQVAQGLGAAAQYAPALMGGNNQGQSQNFWNGPSMNVRPGYGGDNLTPYAFMRPSAPVYGR